VCVSLSHHLNRLGKNKTNRTGSVCNRKVGFVDSTQPQSNDEHLGSVSVLDSSRRM
jgi:hypothetical protein